MIPLLVEEGVGGGGRWCPVIYNERPAGTPSPYHPFPSSLGRAKRGEGSWGEGLRRAFSWFLGAAGGMSDCYENGSPAGTPSPDPRRLVKAPSRAPLSPKGERGIVDGGWRPA
jgi:hypothetical protein